MHIAWPRQVAAQLVCLFAHLTTTLMASVTKINECESQGKGLFPTLTPIKPQTITAQSTASCHASACAK